MTIDNHSSPFYDRERLKKINDSFGDGNGMKLKIVSRSDSGFREKFINTINESALELGVQVGEVKLEVAKIVEETDSRKISLAELTAPSSKVLANALKILRKVDGVIRVGLASPPRSVRATLIK